MADYLEVFLHELPFVEMFRRAPLFLELAFWN